MTRKQVDDLTYEVIGAAIEVHRTVGPGLLESAYHKLMLRELQHRGLSVKSELKVPMIYRGTEIIAGLRCDLLVNDTVLLELKSVDRIARVHQAQVLTYMRLLKIPKGIVVNFNCTNIFKEGQRTFVNDIYEKLPRA